MSKVVDVSTKKIFTVELDEETVDILAALHYVTGGDPSGRRGKFDRLIAALRDANGGSIDWQLTTDVRGNASLGEGPYNEERDPFGF